MITPEPDPTPRRADFGRFDAKSVVTLPTFFEPSLCRKIRLAMDRGVVEPAEVLADGPSLDGEARRASIIEVDPGTLATVEARLDSLRLSLSAVWMTSLVGREGAGFVRYSDGGFYRPHRDRVADSAWPDGALRLVSVVVFLNDGFAGGELTIYPDSGGPIEIAPREGSLVAFDAALLHEVHDVAGGPRDVVVDWFY